MNKELKAKINAIVRDATKKPKVEVVFLAKELMKMGWNLKVDKTINPR